MSHVYHWLVAQGLWHFVVGSIVGMTIGRVFPLGLRTAAKDLRKLADLMDDKTEGGIRAVIDAVEEKNATHQRP